MELFKPGDIIESVDNPKDEEEFMSWVFGGYINETTIVIHSIDDKYSVPYYFQIEKGAIIELPESSTDFDLEIVEAFSYYVQSVDTKKNVIGLTKASEID